MPTPKEQLLAVTTALIDDEAIPARLLALGNAAAILMMADESMTALFTPAFGSPEALADRLRQLVDQNPGVHIKLVIIGGGLDERALLPRGGGGLLARRAVQLFHLGQEDGGWSLWMGGGARADSPVGRALTRAQQGELPPADPTALAERVDPPAPLAPEERKRLEAGQAFIQSLQVRPRATWGVLAFLTVVFLCETWWGDSESLPTLVRMGANTDAALAGEPWRLLSSALLHAGLLHIGLNGYVLVMLGGFMEKVLGPGRYGVLLGAAALGGGLASALVSPMTVSVGASGAIWGVLGAAAALAWRPADAIPQMMIQPLRRNAVINLGLGLAISFVPQVDLWAHLGGGAAGALLVGSGVLTRGLRHPAAQAQAQDQDQEESATSPSRQFSIAAGVVVGAMVASLAAAWVVGKPWQLAGEPTWTRHALEDGMEVEAPVLLGEPQPMESDGIQFWAVGEILRDPIAMVIKRVELTDAERQANLTFYRAEGLSVPDGATESLAWRERETKTWPAFEQEYQYPNGVIEGYWVQVRHGRELHIQSWRLPERPERWRAALDRMYFSLEDP